MYRRLDQAPFPAEKPWPKKSRINASCIYPASCLTANVCAPPLRFAPRAYWLAPAACAAFFECLEPDFLWCSPVLWAGISCMFA